MISSDRPSYDTISDNTIWCDTLLYAMKLSSSLLAQSRHRDTLGAGAKALATVQIARKAIAVPRSRQLWTWSTCPRQCMGSGSANVRIARLLHAIFVESRNTWKRLAKVLERTLRVQSKTCDARSVHIQLGAKNLCRLAVGSSRINEANLRKSDPESIRNLCCNTVSYTHLTLPTKA